MNVNFLVLPCWKCGEEEYKELLDEETDFVPCKCGTERDAILLLQPEQKKAIRLTAAYAAAYAAKYA